MQKPGNIACRHSIKVEESCNKCAAENSQVEAVVQSGTKEGHEAAQQRGGFGSTLVSACTKPNISPSVHEAEAMLPMSEYLIRNKAPEDVTVCGNTPHGVVWLAQQLFANLRI